MVGIILQLLKHNILCTSMDTSAAAHAWTYGAHAHVLNDRVLKNRCCTACGQTLFRTDRSVPVQNTAVCSDLSVLHSIQPHLRADTTVRMPNCRRRARFYATRGQAPYPPSGGPPNRGWTTSMTRSLATHISRLSHYDRRASAAASAPSRLIKYVAPLFDLKGSCAVQC